MKLRTIITAILLLFVAASVVHLLVKEVSGGRSGAQQETPAVSSDRQTPQRLDPGTTTAPSAIARKVVAYYFHGNMRCMTCRTIEAYAKEAVETGFHEALKTGRLEWRIVNIDEPDNQHYVQDFHLITRALVIEEVVDGTRKRWNNLDRVWKLVRDKDAFIGYVQDELRAYLNANE